MTARSLLLAWTALVAAVPVAAFAADQLNEINPAVASMIAELNLKEADLPVRETKGWRKPDRIVVRAESPPAWPVSSRWPPVSSSSPRRTRLLRWP